MSDVVPVSKRAWPGTVRFGSEETRPAYVAEAVHAEALYPGKCQACGAFGTVRKSYPEALSSMYAEVCGDCAALGEDEIGRRVLAVPVSRRDKAGT